MNIRAGCLICTRTRRRGQNSICIVRVTLFAGNKLDIRLPWTNRRRRDAEGGHSREILQAHAHPSLTTTSTMFLLILRHVHSLLIANVHACSYCHPQRGAFQQIVESKRTSYSVAGALTALAFLTRFYKINNPDQVV